MTKESFYELQLIDCNCNDCRYMIRDIEKVNRARNQSMTYAYISFEAAKNRLLDAAKYWEDEGDFIKAKALVIEANKIKVGNYHPQQLIQYGFCNKFNKPVSFIPNVCQLETQKCFVHRKL